MDGRVQDVNDAQLSQGSFSAESLLRQLGVIFSFETTLVLFLFAGIYKEDPRFAWIPGDITLLAFGLSFVTGLYIVVRRGIVLRRENMLMASLALLFVLWAMLSYLWTPSISYSIRKVGLLSSLTLWPLAAFALVVSAERERVRRFFIVLVLFSLWIGIESGVALIMAALQGVRGFIKTTLSTNYLGLARVIGPGMLVLVTYQIYFLRGRWQKLFGGMMITLYAILLLGIGSRGPFLAMFLSSLLIVIVNLRPGRNLRQLTAQSLVVMAIACGMVGTVYFFETTGAELPTTIRRLQEAREEGLQGSSRFEGYATTWRLLGESPLIGRGIGSWPVLTGRGDIRAYPHNIFLEVMFELGMVGLLIFAMILLYAWRQIPHLHVLRREPWMMLAVAQLLSAFINANISGDLNDNKLFWAFTGLIVVCSLQRQVLQPELESVSGPLAGPSQPITSA